MPRWAPRWHRIRMPHPALYASPKVLKVVMRTVQEQMPRGSRVPLGKHFSVVGFNPPEALSLSGGFVLEFPPLARG
jgi:hypothetical protein